MVAKKSYNSGRMRRLVKNRALYRMILPGLLFFVTFNFIPMLGLVISLQDYQPYLGFLTTPWVGFKHFERLFTDPMFFTILRNTLLLFFMNLLFYFPVPILLALMLNEVRREYFKRVIQTLVYIPHFMSWVIIVSISFVMLSMD